MCCAAQLPPEEVAELQAEPEVELDAGEQLEWDKRQAELKHGKAACRLRQTLCPEMSASKFDTYTGGALYMVCACGLMFPPLELPSAESTTMVLLYILQLFQDIPFNARGDQIIISFDDMCHLLRFIQKRAHLHPKLKEFIEKVTPVVDKFHFRKNHKGKFCSKYTNPYKIPELKDANLSLCEQKFSIVANHRHHMNQMGRDRFKFMLSKLSDLDFKFAALPSFSVGG